MLGAGTFQFNQADAVEWLRSLPSDSADIDPFMGSGSARVAALKLGRRFLGNGVADESLLLARRRLLELAGEEGSLLAPEQSKSLPFALASTR